MLFSICSPLVPTAAIINKFTYEELNDEGIDLRLTSVCVIQKNARYTPEMLLKHDIVQEDNLAIFTLKRVFPTIIGSGGLVRSIDALRSIQ